MTTRDRVKYNAYMNDYMKRRYANRRAVAVASLGGKCVVCGSSENLELDHIDPSEKEFSMSMAASFSKERWDNELAKCQLLCETCHKEKHATKAPCGTPQKFWSGCKCDACRRAHNDHHNEYRRQMRQKKNMPL